MEQYIGRLLDNRYEILEIIGTGGMAVVYKARCHRLNRLVAIKILKDEFSRDEEFRRRFHAEGEAVAMLSHPNIVQVYDVSSSDNADFIVMELIDGITLKQYMEKKGVLNWKETLHFGMQIGKALEHAHSRGIVHRDIKPHNVMVLKNGSVKVTDFGIARVMSKSNTLTKEALGSVHYISPEQAKGGWVDNRSDLYSLGVVMYEMMTGRPPYDGESPVAVAIQHINGGAPAPSTLNPNIPGGLEQIIRKAMALDTKDRYASATEMLRDMDEFRKDPSMLFAYRTVLDDATKPIPSEVLRPRTTAERVAQEKAGMPPRQRGMETQQRTRQSQQQSNPARRRSPENAAAAARTGTQARREGSRSNPRRKSRQEIEAQERRSRMTTIAIVSCSAIAVFAIIIFLIALFNGSLFQQEQPLIQVPSLIGKEYATVHVEGLKIEIDRTTYHSTYSKGQIIDQVPASGSSIVEDSTIKVIVSLGPEPLVKTMENLVGMDGDDAMQFLRGQGMNPLPLEEFSETVPEGEVIRTSPENGDELNDGQTVKLYISVGPIIKKGKVPNVVGLNLATAEAKLNAAGFDLVEFKRVESNKDKDEVVEQSATAGEDLDVTTKIILSVSKGPKATTEATTEPTTEPTTKPTTEPTTKPTEEPTEPEKESTKNVNIPLEAQTEAYDLSIFCDGNEVITLEIEPETKTVTVSLTGKGRQTYDLYRDGTWIGSHTVDFSKNG